MARRRREWLAVVVMIAATVVGCSSGSRAADDAPARNLGTSDTADPVAVVPPTTPALASSIVTTRCEDATSLLRSSRSARLAAANATRRLEWVDVSNLVPRDPPAPDWGSEYLGGSPGGISSLPAGAVSEARTMLVPSGLEEGFVRGFRSDPAGIRVMYAVYRFATTAGATDVADAVIRNACGRKRDFLSTPDGIVGASDSGPEGGGIDLVLVRNRLLFDFSADGPVIDLASIEQLALDFFAKGHNATPGPDGPVDVARATATRACSRLFFANSVPEASTLTLGEFRSAAREELAAIRREGTDPDAEAVAKTLRTLVDTLTDRRSRFSVWDVATDEAAALDNSCRQLTGRGVFRA